MISLDCDTRRDLGVVTDVHERLRAVGITPTYAVPGSLLELGTDVYRAIAAEGAEFVNHGWAEHCELDADTRTYTSSYFYDELPRDVVADDVRRGHAAVSEILGRPPTGFRTPHFGTFSRRRDVAWLHELLVGLGYRYSSSTMPLQGLVRGPLWLGTGGIVEIPVSGSPVAPHRVLDTWSYRFAPGRRGREAAYLDEVRTLLRRGGPAILNLYGDPSQVEDWPAWFDLLGELAPYAASSLSAVAAMRR